MNNPFESAFRALVTAGWANTSDGDVESSTGFFAMIDMSTERMPMAEVLAEVGEDPLVITTVEPGWYLVTENSDGHVFIAGPQSESRVTEWYRTKAGAYAKWSLAAAE